MATPAQHHVTSGSMTSVVGWAWVCLLALVTSLTGVTSLTQEFEMTDDRCEYSMDFANNKLKVVCEGTPAQVSIFAQTASVVPRDVNVRPSDKPRGQTGQADAGAPPRGDNTPDPQPTDPGYDLHSEPAPTEHKHRHHGSLPWEENASRAPAYDGNYDAYVINATRQLDRVKRQLSTYNESISNASDQLKMGENKMEDNLYKLTATPNEATELKRRLVMTIKDQFELMTKIMTIRSHYLTKMVQSLNTLVEVTSDGLLSALDAHKRVMEEMAEVNQTLQTVRRQVRGGRGKVKRTGKPKDECPRMIKKIGAGEGHYINASSGAYMVESYNPSVYRSRYVMTGDGFNDQIISYDADVDVYRDLVSGYIKLPYRCSGTGHAVYKRHFYCHKSGSSTLIKYHLRRKDIVDEMELPGVGHTWPYSSNTSDVDLAVDELGLWALYATNASMGKLVISKINQRTMTVSKNWETNYLKHNLANAIMVCGVLYAVDSHSASPTYVRYIYDTNTEPPKEYFLHSELLPFANSAKKLVTWNSQDEKVFHNNDNHQANMSMLSYDFRSQRILSWNNFRLESYPVFYSDKT